VADEEERHPTTAATAEEEVRPAALTRQQRTIMACCDATGRFCGKSGWRCSSLTAGGLHSKARGPYLRRQCFTMDCNTGGWVADCSLAGCQSKQSNQWLAPVLLYACSLGWLAERVLFPCSVASVLFFFRRVSAALSPSLFVLLPDEEGPGNLIFVGVG